ncbi:hypothetical protein [Erythrobacter sp. THAF29]|uniref:hypothetical protein n=1 Tax=Erythrobacter sp. THAF29 TaxID=2587851 RepID=UPI001268CC76|nr:hypothetical protein [Erythrobacter sp. THAF29]
MEQFEPNTIIKPRMGIVLRLKTFSIGSDKVDRRIVERIVAYRDGTMRSGKAFDGIATRPFATGKQQMQP